MPGSSLGMGEDHEETKAGSLGISERYLFFLRCYSVMQQSAM
jgi:hypothetical protein